MFWEKVMLVDGVDVDDNGSEMACGFIYVVCCLLFLILFFLLLFLFPLQSSLSPSLFVCRPSEPSSLHTAYT